MSPRVGRGAHASGLHARPIPLDAPPTAVDREDESIQALIAA